MKPAAWPLCGLCGDYEMKIAGLLPLTGGGPKGGKTENFVLSVSIWGVDLCKFPIIQWLLYRD